MPNQKNEELQNKYLELQLIIQQINQIQQQYVNIQNQILELNNLRDNLSSLQDLKQGTEFFSQLGYNIFTKARINDMNEVLVNVGSNVFVIKTINDAKELISSQISQFEVVLREIEENLRSLESAGQKAQSEILEVSNK